MGINKAEVLEDYKKELSKCTGSQFSCTLRVESKQPVPPEGSPEARLWIVGRNPGRTEDAPIRPFVGPAGECLDRMLEGAEIDRSKVWVTNLCKCYSEGDRPPYPADVKSCFSWLDLEYQLCKPDLVCLLGNQVIRTFFPNAQSASYIHGKVMEGCPVSGMEHWKCRFILLHHPGFVCRKGPLFEATMVEDWKQVALLATNLPPRFV